MAMVRQGWKRSGVISAAGIVALLGTGALAAPASAHTPVWAVTCNQVTVDLTVYDPDVTNEVTIKAGGEVLLPTEKFGNEFHKVLDLPDHSSELDVELIVKAGDSDSFSRDEHKTAPVCKGDQTPPASPSPTPSSAPPSSAAPSSPASSSSAPVSAPAGASNTPSGPLAETGSSSSTPIIAGVAGVVVVAGAGLLFAVRRRRAPRH